MGVGKSAEERALVPLEKSNKILYIHKLRKVCFENEKRIRKCS